MVAFQGLRWDVSAVTWSGRDEDGHPLVQENAYGGEGSAPFYCQHQYGTYARPHDPAPGNNGVGDAWCTLLVASDGSTYIGQLGYDPRFIGLIPLPPKGSAMQYAGFHPADDPKNWKASFAFISGDDGTWQFYRPAKDGGKDSVLAVTLGVDGGGENVIEFRHPDGSLISMFDGSIVLKCPNGTNYIQVSDDGIVLKGPITQMGGLSTPGGVTLTKGPEFATFATNVLACLTQIQVSLAKLQVAPTAPVLAASLADIATLLGTNVPLAADAAAVAQTNVTRGS